MPQNIYETNNIRFRDFAIMGPIPAPQNPCRDWFFTVWKMLCFTMLLLNLPWGRIPNGAGFRRNHCVRNVSCAHSISCRRRRWGFMYQLVLTHYCAHTFCTCLMGSSWFSSRRIQNDTHKVCKSKVSTGNDTFFKQCKFNDFTKAIHTEIFLYVRNANSSFWLQILDIFLQKKNTILLSSNLGILTKTHYENKRKTNISKSLNKTHIGDVATMWKSRSAKHQ